MTLVLSPYIILCEGFFLLVEKKFVLFLTSFGNFRLHKIGFERLYRCKNEIEC